MIEEDEVSTSIFETRVSKIRIRGGEHEIKDCYSYGKQNCRTTESNINGITELYNIETASFVTNDTENTESTYKYRTVIFTVKFDYIFYGLFLGYLNATLQSVTA